ncbi:hypothetical protein K8I28_10780 [bacterium]|nr:hypothetical protein [bacterium]
MKPLTFPYRAFDCIGIELEYMIVQKNSLDVLPVADRLLNVDSTTAGQDSEREFDDFSWSNELAMHVLEIKTSPPVKKMDGLEKRFQEQLNHANRMLDSFDATLLPTAMHPWMNPANETRLWKARQTEIYHAYDKIFNCSGHGWSNLQSTHINLPFGDEEEFRRLHAAIRVALPLLPALAASSPVVEGKAGQALDMRLEFYRKNQSRVPSLSAHIVPEAINSFAEYNEIIFERIYRDISPFDPDGILQDE